MLNTLKSFTRYSPPSILVHPALPGVLLFLCAAAALLLTNSAFGPEYLAFWDQSIRLGPEALGLEKSLQVWINDGLLAIFFLYVTLEIKREVLYGQLSQWRTAALPAFGALGGMLIPVGLFLLLVPATSNAAGYGIPMATDIAFGFGILALLGSSVPAALKMFVLAFAIIDDIGAIGVIAFAYTDSISWMYLLYGGGVLILLWLLNRTRIHWAWYLIPGAILWFFILKSGVHATLAGVLLAAFIPARRPVDKSDEPDQAHKMEYALKPWVLYLILPLFALANSGVLIKGGPAPDMGLALAIGGGMIFGKLIGVLGFSWVGVKLGWASLSNGLTWPMIAGAGLIGGVGFTMALFIATLAYDGGGALTAAKIGVLTGSLIAGIGAFFWLKIHLKKKV